MIYFYGISVLFQVMLSIIGILENNHEVRNQAEIMIGILSILIYLEILRKK
jgi:hypothetical protein